MQQKRVRRSSKYYFRSYFCWYFNIKLLFGLVKGKEQDQLEIKDSFFIFLSTNLPKFEKLWALGIQTKGLKLNCLDIIENLVSLDYKGAATINTNTNSPLLPLIKFAQVSLRIREKSKVRVISLSDWSLTILNNKRLIQKNNKIIIKSFWIHHCKLNKI